LIGAVVLAAFGIGSALNSRSGTTRPASPAAANPSPLKVIVDGLDGPTQFADGPGDWLLVAQLAGDENAKTGEVVAVDPSSKKRITLLRNLNKPTGVAWLNGFVWVMEQRRLARASWGGSGTTVGALEVMVDDLPFNGRSEGTLTPTPDNRLLYETTGAISGDAVVAGSGTLWVFDPLTKKSTKVAVGLKNAYAHVFASNGKLFATEIGDNIEQAPVEEINEVPYAGPNSNATNFGWPSCPGDQKCAGVVSPLATFEPNATPTGVAVDSTYAYVVLLVTGELRRVKLDDGSQTVMRTGLESPHTILRRPDGALWVSEHLGGRIVEVPS
jgi:glucose/arabinose dehydrogenase